MGEELIQNSTHHLQPQMFEVVQWKETMAKAVVETWRRKCSEAEWIAGTGKETLAEMPLRKTQGQQTDLLVLAAIEAAVVLAES